MRVGICGARVQLLTVDSWGRVPVAYSGYMTAGGPASHMYMGQGSSCLQWVHGGGVQLLIEGTCGQGIQLLTVGT